MAALSGWSGSMPFRPQRLPRQELGVAAQQDIRASTGHVRRDSDRALATGLGDDPCLTLVMLGVQHFVRNTNPLEPAG